MNKGVENNKVKTIHDVSSSYMDEEKVLYLSSRRMNENEARFLIAKGFLKKMKNENFANLNLSKQKIP
ncbi:MAG: SufD family Fe-S cluster assembly protein [Candidatus Aenigmatarchaeota archaeon]